jgi:hypothetical protein
MSKITGRIGKFFVDLTFSNSKVVFKEKEKTKNQMTDIWFIYFQRISKRLKTCDAVMFDGKEIIEFTTSQKNIESISDKATCPVYFGGMDPLPWKRLMREANKHKWQCEDWQHMFEESAHKSESDSDGDWKPPSDSESDDDESDADESDADESDDVSDDDEPVAKRPCRRVDE